jgi:hypothetical protein
MGTAHLEVSQKLLGEILLNDFWPDFVRVESASYWGEGDFYHLLIKTSLLSDGYHGTVNIIVDGDRIRFKKDQDV